MNFKLSFERNFMPEKELLLAKSLCNAYTFRTHGSTIQDSKQDGPGIWFRDLQHKHSNNQRRCYAEKISATVKKYETIKLPNNDLHILSQTTF